MTTIHREEVQIGVPFYCSYNVTFKRNPSNAYGSEGINVWYVKEEKEKCKLHKYMVGVTGLGYSGQWALVDTVCYDDGFVAHLLREVD